MWNKLFPQYSEIGELIGRDMEFHKLKAQDVKEFCKNKNQAKVLLLAALASFYSNSELFGGEESDSYKIKKKHMEKRGQQVCQEIFGK